MPRLANGWKIADFGPLRAYGMLPGLDTEQVNLSDTIGAAGLRRTGVRVAVLTALTRSGRPHSVQELQQELPESDAVTLYRTLHTFESKRLVHRVLGRDRVWRYATGEAPTAQDHGHVHFVCDGCGTVSCLDDSPIPTDLGDQLAIDEAFRVTRTEVTLHGQCPDCQSDD